MTTGITGRQVQDESLTGDDILDESIAVADLAPGVQDTLTLAEALDTRVGALADLDTTDKSSIVAAINEAAQGAAGATIQQLLTTADFARSSTAFADVPGLSTTLVANSTYKFDFVVMFDSSNTKGGVGFGLNGTATATRVLAQYVISRSLSVQSIGMSRDYDSGPISPDVDIANAPYIATISGLIKTGAGGTFGLRFRCEATYQARVLAGSIGTIVKGSP